MDRKGQFRQGDVLLVPIGEIPKEAEKKDNVLVLGEATGHSHRIENGLVLAFGNEQFVEAKEGTVLVHEEHDEMAIPTGKYRLVRQREFDLVDEVRQVND